MRNITITTLIALLCVFCVQAKYNSLKVTFTDGSEVRIDLTDSTIINFSDGNIIFANPGENLSYSLAEVEKYAYSEEKLCQITLPEASLGEGAGIITIYNTKGEKVMQALNNANSTLQLQNLPKGVYILIDGKNQPTKIIR